MIQEYLLIPLDIFLESQHNISNRWDAWLTVIASSDPERILDTNTTKYMIEEQKEKLRKQEEELRKREEEIRKQREEIKSQQEELLSAKAALAEKDSENQRLKALLAAKE